MCVPTPKEPAAAAIQVPSIETADNLQLAGGPARGAAQLGRLALRLGRATPDAASPKPPTPAAGETSGAVTASGVPGALPGLSSTGVGAGLSTLRFAEAAQYGRFN